MALEAVAQCYNMHRGLLRGLRVLVVVDNDSPTALRQKLFHGSALWRRYGTRQPFFNKRGGKVRQCIRPQGVLWTLFLCGLSIVSPLNAQVSDGPLGLPWGMPKEAVERLGIRLCCRQVGTWGTRYTVARHDFNKLPRSLVVYPQPAANSAA